MKKILTCLFGFFCFVSVFAATTMYIGTEQKYIFTAENLAQTIPEFVENEKKQEKMAETYTRVMNQETGAVSVANLFEVCRAGGFNTYRQTGYEQCRNFILKLLENAEQEVEEGFLDGFCPAAYDENGKQQNGLRSIGDQTRIGDFCSSTNIAGGEVVFRKGYNCTCAAYACNPGFQSEKGACVTEYKDANGDCLRKEYTNMTNITKAEEALQFCESKAVKGCKVRNAIRNFGGVKGRIVCNATREEVDNAKARMLDAQDKKIANLQYYDVCRQYKGKTGKKEYCIDKLFSGLDVGLNEAAGLAQLYATEKNGHTIYCDPSHNKRTINDYFNCSTLDKSIYYTFKFDDTVETKDAKKFRNTVRGIALIYGLPQSSNNVIYGACTTKLQNAAKRFGMKAETKNGSCSFDYGIKTDNKNVDSALHTIDGIDNYVFYHEIQLRGSTRLRDNLKQYIKSQGFVVTGFDCDNSYGRIKKRVIEGDDETLTCRLTGTKDGVRYTNQPVDFVFDDLSESWKTTREAGESGMACIISGGAYANKNCHGLDQNQCSQVNAKLKAENPKSSGTKWQNGQCVLIDVKEQNRLENGIQIGLSVIALADCATVVIGNAQGVMGCTLAVVEITGLATELTTGAAMQQRADEFIKIAVACNNRSCAKNTLKTMAGKAITVQDALKSASTAHQIDVQLARLVEYLEPEDLQSEVSPNDWDDIVRQLGGDPNDTAGRALKIANKIGFIAQFASLGASALRLTGRAVAKIAAKSATKTAVSGTKALAVVGAHADDAASAFAKTASHADDAADAARGAAAGAKAAGSADDAARGASAGAKAAGNADDAARGASSGAKAAGNAGDAARGASSGTSAAGKAQDIIYDAAYFSRNTSGSDDVFRGADDLVQVNRQNMSAATIRDIMRKAKQYGFECTDCGGDILKFSKSTDNVSDAARGASKADDVADATRGAGRSANNTSDAGKGTSNSGRAASGAADAGKGGKAADNASKTTRAANLYEDWKVAGKGRESYEFDFAVLGNNEKELTEFIGYVQKDGYYIQKVGNRIFVKDALSDLYKRAATGDKNVFARKDVLSPQRWEELNQRVSKLGLKFVDDNETAGFMKLVRETPAKTGDELIKSLRMKNWNGQQQRNFYYMFIPGRSSGQHVTGLKFHISVDASDLDRATDIIGNSMKRSGIGGQFKVYLDPDATSWMDQAGKEFTVYVSQDGYNSGKLQQFVRECEQGLRNAGVKTNGFGSNVSGGDRAVSGSQYIRYRYDQLDDFGKPQGFYREKYDFVAPNSQYGGDIMNGISAN